MNHWMKNRRVSMSYSIFIKEHNLKIDILKTKLEKNLFSFICFENYILKTLVESGSQYNHTGELSVYKYRKLREVWDLTNINYISYNPEPNGFGLIICSITSDSINTINSKNINIF